MGKFRVNIEGMTPGAQCVTLGSKEDFEEWAASEGFGFAVCYDASDPDFEAPFLLVKVFNNASDLWEVKSLGTLGDPWVWPEI